MNVSHVKQQAVTTVNTVTVDDKQRKSEEGHTTQNSIVDTVELSDEAVALSREADTDTNS